MIQERVLSRYIKRINNELATCGSGSPRLISLKLLYPNNTKQTELQPFLALCSDISHKEYSKFEKDFVSPDTNTFRTLSFQKYKEAFRISSIHGANGSCSKTEYEYYKEEIIPIDANNQNELCEGKINQYWTAWQDDIKKKLLKGKSTLWSYVVIPREINEVYTKITGSAFLIFSDNVCEKAGILINKYCQDLLIECITSHYYDEIIETATRAAISQVTARNTSHNIGAHVMNKLIGDLSQIKISNFKNYKSDITLFEEKKDNIEILLDQISIFNNYVKCRMDYLADISFGTPLMQTNKYAYADLFKELDKVRLLLEHISGLDDFKFEIKFKKNGKDLNDKNDLLVAIPNDILGAQAFYNILENIIRNSAKHSDKSRLGEDLKVVFTVNFIDDIAGVKGYCKKKKRR
ncbi:MAG: hypothetical protein IPH93_15155 [Saprospiraceae bacterium]|nr:hypothetical protein [Saprospiraceae bacterium]